MSAYADALAVCAELGWPIIGMAPGAKYPVGRNDWQRRGATDPGPVRDWLDRGRNIGFVTGDGHVGIDVDPRNGGEETLRQLERELGPLPDTITVRSGGGGAHYHLRTPEPIKCGELATGIDVKGQRGLLVAPPSLHPNGRRYTWGRWPGEAAAAPLPDAWLDRLRPDPPAVPTPLRRHDDSRVEWLRSIPAEVYVTRLTGQPVGRSGKVRCPLHADGRERTPSLHVYGGSAGWYCFGCHRGGDLFTLASRLVGVRALGSDWRALVDALTEEFADDREHGHGRWPADEQRR